MSIKEAKVEMDRKILEAITEFEKETDVRVESYNIKATIKVFSDEYGNPAIAKTFKKPVVEFSIGD